MAGAEILRWQKASGCESNACVEVAMAANRVAVRDGKDPAGPRLDFTAAEWQSFISWMRDRDR